MSKKTNIKICSLFATLPMLFVSSQVLAKPWLDAGDMKLRHELQLLSDARLLDSPLTTWPLAAKDIHENLKEPVKDSPMLPALRQAYANVKQRLKEEDYNSSFKITADARSQELLIRDFSEEGREKYSVSYDGEWGNPFIDVRLKATVADETDHPDDSAFRLDESYIASDLGNWKVTVGQQSRYWGPGWDGSLILSNNARPIPSISVENVLSKPDEDDFFLLRWLGTSKLHAFVGQLESDRGIPDAKLIGTRFTFRPFKPLEIGLHRTIQWGGEGQDESFSDFSKTFFSVRVEEQDGSLGTVRGNQIAGLDFRWKLPVGGTSNHYSVYGQYIGEDRVDGSILLGDEVFMLGGSVAGYSKKLKGSWRAYLEATDTSAGSYKGRDRNNIVYNHSSYTDGYRYLDVSMGHGIDSDSQIVSAGLILNQNNGNFWRGWVKHAKLNEDGVGNNPIAPNGKEWSAVGLSLEKPLNIDTKINLGVQLISERDYSSKRENDVGISLGFTKSF
jgi:hypothetical protein